MKALQPASGYLLLLSNNTSRADISTFDAERVSHAHVHTHTRTHADFEGLCRAKGNGETHREEDRQTERNAACSDKTGKEV